jgi:prepilin-type N-terminal cleavage/methylation domain-containing protein
MIIRRQNGFTLIEIMMVIAILGILAATAIPFYKTWQQRAYGSEASIMMKQLLDAEINYYLEHNKFFPDNQTYVIHPDGSSDPAGVFDEIRDNLNIAIPVGHPLEYYLAGINSPDPNPMSTQFVVTVKSKSEDFYLFKGNPFIIGTVYSTGKTEYSYMDD